MEKVITASSNRIDGIFISAILNARNNPSRFLAEVQTGLGGWGGALFKCRRPQQKREIKMAALTC
jgi:hypothetical protein